jgi:subtilisin family serine protease
MPATLNPELVLALSRWQAERAELVATDASPEALEALDATRVDVFVTYNGPPEALNDSPLSLGHYDGVVATGWLRIAEVEALQQLDGVTRINKAALVAAHIDRSMNEIKADAIRSKAPPYVADNAARAYTGKGVLIGIIDDSLWEGHLSFITRPSKQSPQRTRIVGIWDQGPPRSGSPSRPTPPGFNYGKFWDESAINSVLASGVAGFQAIPSTSAFDHGSHVTGIAAANGAITDNGTPPFTLVGVAPEADIAFCNAISYDFMYPTTNAVADAVKFLFDLASSRHQPCVINMSFGTHEGARDGSSDLERAIDRQLLDGSGRPVPGRAVVVAAGNERGARRHSRKLMTPRGTLWFHFDIAPYTEGRLTVSAQRPADNKFLREDHLFIWYRAEATLEIRITPPGGTADPAGWVAFGDVRVSPSIGVTSGAPVPATGKNYICITLWAPIKNGQWKLELRETAGVETPIDIWVERTDAYVHPRFVDGDHHDDNTISCPASGSTVITVGGYVTSPRPGENYGDIYDHSSRGLDAAYQASAEATRPHLVAPARRIISTNNSFKADEKDALAIVKARLGTEPVYHALISGTSQATPHVTGVVALMLQKNPNLTAAEIRKILTSTADQSKIPVQRFPSRIWGYGKVNAKAALDATP